MADSKISNLPTATALDGTEVLPIVQSTTTKQVTAQTLGGTVLFNGMVNDSLTSVLDDYLTFTLPSAISTPTLVAGDRVEIEMSFFVNTAPPSGGFGLYFEWNNITYTPFSQTTPTYANSVLKLPFDEMRTNIKVTVDYYSASSYYVQWEQKITNDAVMLNNYTNGACGFMEGTDDLNLATAFKVEAFITGGGEVTLEHLYIKHTK